MMTPADDLRAAAAKIRARAEVATEGPWRVDHPEYPEVVYGGKDGNDCVIAGSRWGGEANVFDNNDDAYHIALWNPVVAVLVADLLDDVSRSWLGRDDEAELFGTLTVAKLARAINDKVSV